MLNVFLSGEVKYTQENPNRFDQNKKDLFILLKLVEVPAADLKDTVALAINGVSNRMSIGSGDQLFINGASLDSYVSKQGLLIGQIKPTVSSVVIPRDQVTTPTNLVYGSGVKVIQDSLGTFGDYNICKCRYSTVKYNKGKNGQQSERTVVEKDFEVIWPAIDPNGITNYLQNAGDRQLLIIGSIATIPATDDPNSKTTTAVVLLKEVRIA